jgi:carbamoyl-phosphate synthase large subunit
VTVSHFRELEVWQLAMSLATLIYRLTAGFPREERYGLSAQMQRAAVSIPSNIAEGNARQSTREYARFVSTASGSTAELQTQLLLAQQLGVGDASQIDRSLEYCERVGMMLLRLHQSLIQKTETSAVPESRVPSPESRLY